MIFLSFSLIIAWNLCLKVFSHAFSCWFYICLHLHIFVKKRTYVLTQMHLCFSLNALAFWFKRTCVLDWMNLRFRESDITNWWWCFPPLLLLYCDSTESGVILPALELKLRIWFQNYCHSHLKYKWIHYLCVCQTAHYLHRLLHSGTSSPLNIYSEVHTLKPFTS